ncbi:MAG: hypothetical protein ABEJ06_05095 [Haloarculaceae archaeon]
MSGTISIHVNRDDLYALEAPESFSTDGPFAVELHNHGAPVHVHLNLDDPLARLADFAATNRYLEEDATERIDVPVRSGTGTVTGTLTVATAHGGEQRAVAVTVDRQEDSRVEVDPDLARSVGRESEGSLSAAFGGANLDRSAVETLGVAALGVVAIVIAVGVVAAVGGLGAAIGAFVVLLAVAAAVYLVSS